MFFAALSKEFKLVFRDIHSVLVLFLMPAIFIIIMSLALQEQFDEEKSSPLTVYYSSDETDEFSTMFIKKLNHQKGISFQPIEMPSNEDDIVKNLESDIQGFLHIPSSLFDHFQSDLEDVTPLKLHLSPKVSITVQQLIQGAVIASLAETKLFFSFTPQMSQQEKDRPFINQESLKTIFISKHADTEQRPTAVQQNVPAWLIFSMFFVVVPLSTTLITERQQGTLNRLRAMHIPMSVFLAAKAIPYLLINQFQLLTMVLLGVFLVPLLGGDRLIVNSNILPLMLMSLAVGISAIGYALLIAVIAKTTEQAVSIGGVGNILFGAIGGIMVPKFVMPDYLQPVTAISPMSWGLDGFLQVFLYNGDVLSIIPEASMLIIFGLIMLILALGTYSRQR